MKEFFGKIGKAISKHKVAALLILLVVAVGGLFAAKAMNAKKAPATNVDRQTAEVERRDLSQKVTLSGTVQGGELYSVASYITGVSVKSVNVRTGDVVKAGQVIATLDDTQAREDANDAQEKLSDTKKSGSISVENARRNYKTAVNDSKSTKKKNETNLYVAQTDYYRALETRDKAWAEYDEANHEAQLMRDEVNWKLDDLKSEREAKIAAFKEIPKDDPDKEKEYAVIDQLDTEIAEYEKKLKSLESTEESALNTYNKAQKALEDAVVALDKAELAATDATRKANDDLESAESSLEKAKLNAKDSLISPKSDVRKAQRTVDKCTIVAQTDGIVTAVNVKAGDSYKGEAIATIQDTTSLQINATADQYDINSLEQGMDSSVTVTAAKLKNLKGTLVHVASTPLASSKNSDSSKAEYQVVSTVDNSSNKLKVGMNAKVVISLREKKNVLVVPDSCVQTDENGNKYVEVVKGVGTERVGVEYGMRTDYYSEIISDDIKEGMQVVIPASDDAANAGFY